MFSPKVEDGQTPIFGACGLQLPGQWQRVSEWVSRPRGTMRKVERKLSLMLEDGAGIVEDRFEDPIKHQPTSLSVLHMISQVTTLKVLNIGQCMWI